MATSVYLYLPNLIGYTRIILCIAAFHYVYTDYVKFFVCYSISALLDIADGHAARALNQCTRFGAVLDMITDRASTSCLIVVLAQYFPNLSKLLIFFVAIDIMSHFAHLYSSLVRGVKSHKEINEKQSFLLRMYYTKRWVLGFLCFGNEGFFACLYLLNHWAGPVIPWGPLVFLAPYIGNSAGELTLTSAVVWLLMAPIMFVKQSINVVQLLQAAVDIVEVDYKERAKDLTNKKIKTTIARKTRAE